MPSFNVPGFTQLTNITGFAPHGITPNLGGLQEFGFGSDQFSSFMNSGGVGFSPLDDMIFGQPVNFAQQTGDPNSDIRMFLHGDQGFRNIGAGSASSFQLSDPNAIPPDPPPPIAPPPVDTGQTVDDGLVQPPPVDPPPGDQPPASNVFDQAAFLPAFDLAKTFFPSNMYGTMPSTALANLVATGRGPGFDMTGITSQTDFLNRVRQTPGGVDWYNNTFIPSLSEIGNFTANVAPGQEPPPGFAGEQPDGGVSMSIINALLYGALSGGGTALDSIFGGSGVSRFGGQAADSLLGPLRTGITDAGTNLSGLSLPDNLLSNVREIGNFVPPAALRPGSGFGQNVSDIAGNVADIQGFTTPTDLSNIGSFRGSTGDIVANLQNIARDAPLANTALGDVDVPDFAPVLNNLQAIPGAATKATGGLAAALQAMGPQGTAILKILTDLGKIPGEASAATGALSPVAASDVGFEDNFLSNLKNLMPTGLTVGADEVQLPTAADLRGELGDVVLGADDFTISPYAQQGLRDDLGDINIGSSQFNISPHAQTMLRNELGQIGIGAGQFDIAEGTSDDILQRVISTLGKITGSDVGLDQITRPELQKYTDSDLGLDQITRPDLAQYTPGDLGLDKITRPELARYTDSDLGLDQIQRPDLARYTESDLGLDKISRPDLAQYTGADLGLDKISRPELSRYTATDLGLDQIVRPELAQYTAGDLGLDRISRPELSQYTAADLGLDKIVRPELAQYTLADLGLDQIKRPTLDKFTGSDLGLDQITRPELDKFTDSDLGLDQIERPTLDKYTGTDLGLDQISRPDIGRYTPGELGLDDISRPTLDKFTDSDLGLDKIQRPTLAKYTTGDLGLDDITRPALAKYTTGDLGLDQISRPDIGTYSASDVGLDNAGLDNIFAGADSRMSQLRTDMSNLGLPDGFVDDIASLAENNDTLGLLAAIDGSGLQGDDLTALNTLLSQFRTGFLGDVTGATQGPLDAFGTKLDDLSSAVSARPSAQDIADLVPTPQPNVFNFTGGGGAGGATAGTGTDATQPGYNAFLQTLMDQITGNLGDPTPDAAALREDPITASILADLQDRRVNEEAQLREDLNRMGLLTTGAEDTGRALGTLRSGFNRAESSALSEGAQRLQDLRTGAVTRGTALADTGTRRELGLGELDLGKRQADLDLLASAIAAMDPALDVGSRDPKQQGLASLIVGMMDLDEETKNALLGIFGGNS